ncbi:MAG: phosphoribosylaminoimidazolesuccinocarboxamide synthase, partial [Candidatus Dormibacteraceae bacterium]
MIQLNEQEILLESHLPGIQLFSRGKVRDVYEVSGGRLLIIATDRLSAFDVVMTEGIPGKGKVLTQLSMFWFNFLNGIVPHHFITADVREYPRQLQPFASQLEGRSMLVKKTEPFPIECVVRGYLAGSGWKDYQ